MYIVQVHELRVLQHTNRVQIQYYSIHGLQPEREIVYKQVDNIFLEPNMDLQLHVDL